MLERINFFNLRAQTHPPVADSINEVRQWPDLPPQSKFLRQGSGKHELHKPFLFKRKCWFLLSAYIPGELRSFAYLAGRYMGEVSKLNPTCIPNAISKVSPMGSALDPSNSEVPQIGFRLISVVCLHCGVIQRRNFLQNVGVVSRFHARFIHATLIGVMLNFWKVGVAPTTPLYTKTPPLALPEQETHCLNHWRMSGVEHRY